MKTYVVGHKNPDTDSILSAIVVADILGDDFIPAKQGEPNKEALYALDKFGFKVPADLPSAERRIVLVDHNSPGEGPSDLKPEEIVAIFDHHKLGGPITADPAEIRIEKVGCTATVVFEMYQEKGLKPSDGTAGLMLAAIISDTLKFSSPTTTDRDKRVATELAERLKLDIEELATSMFAAKSDISDITSEELINKDYKVFNLSGNQVGVGVWETVLPDSVLARKKEIADLLRQKRDADELDYILFAVVDILGNKSEIIVATDAERVLTEAVFGGTVRDSVLDCPGVVSRKKQITPPIEKYLGAK